MILIKDRHISLFVLIIRNREGKYDTYKGSTLDSFTKNLLFSLRGKYDTYKGSTRNGIKTLNRKRVLGKYDTYKGSTLEYKFFKICFHDLGNMILIKDRHTYSSTINSFE